MMPNKCLGGPIFESRNEIWILGQAQKFRVIFQKYELKSINFFRK